jgi:predicted cupin superfamily sugar epimerase
MQTADYWIHHLHLQAHPEGGFYRETYRSTEFISTSALPSRFAGNRSFSTAIYFLLRSEDRSLLHRIQSDELWHFHAGTSLSIYVFDAFGLTIHRLGNNPEKGESLQIVVPAGSWFGALVNDANGYTLSGCTVAPGFDFQDFELASRKNLTSEFPEHRSVIEMLTATEA